MVFNKRVFVLVGLDIVFFIFVIIFFNMDIDDEFMFIVFSEDDMFLDDSDNDIFGDDGE